MTELWLEMHKMQPAFHAWMNYIWIIKSSSLWVIKKVFHIKTLIFRLFETWQFHRKSSLILNAKPLHALITLVWMPFTHPKSEADQTQSSHDLNQLCGLNTATIGFGGFFGFLPFTMGSKLVWRKVIII